MPSPLSVISPTPSSCPQFPTTLKPQGSESSPTPECKYTLFGELIPLQSVPELLISTVIVTDWSTSIVLGLVVI